MVALDWRDQCRPHTAHTACPHHGHPADLPHLQRSTPQPGNRLRPQGPSSNGASSPPGRQRKVGSARPIRASQPPRPRPLPADTLGCRRTRSASGKGRSVGCPTSDDPCPVQDGSAGSDGKQSVGLSSCFPILSPAQSGDAALGNRLPAGGAVPCQFHLGRKHGG